MRRIIDDQYAVALRILRTNRDLLNKTAKTLLVDEVIAGDALQDLAGAVQAPDPEESVVPDAARRIAAA